MLHSMDNQLFTVTVTVSVSDASSSKMSTDHVGPMPRWLTDERSATRSKGYCLRQSPLEKTKVETINDLFSNVGES